MQTKLETLQQHLEIVTRFETLFSIPDPNALKYALNDENNHDSFQKYTNSKPYYDEAFAQFNFTDLDIRTFHVNAAMELLKTLTHPDNKKTQKSKVRHLFELTIRAILSPVEPNPRDVIVNSIVSFLPDASHLAKTPLETLRYHVLELIKCQKKAIENDIADQKAQQASQMLTENDIAGQKAQQASQMLTEQVAAARRNRIVSYIGASTLFTLGTGLTTFSGLVHFNPQFALLVGIHFPLAALASVAVAGVAIAGLSAYLAYRTYKPAPVAIGAVLVDPVNPKIVAATLMASGLGLGAFASMVQFNAALIQFSPKFALLAGLHLSPVALIAIAAVGALLMSAGLYHMVKKAYKPSTSITTVKTATCYQQITKCMSCCFKFGGSTRPAPSDKKNAIPPVFFGLGKI